MPLNQRNRFVELNERVLSLGQQYMTQPPPERALEFSLDALAGLPSYITSPLKLRSGKVRITVPSTEATLILRHVRNEQTRKLVYETMHAGSEKNLSTLEELLKARYDLATCVGFKSYNEYALRDKMAASPGIGFLFRRVS